MVRLKVKAEIQEVKKELFQFHYGTIKRQTRTRTFTITTLFQFHYGTIKRAGAQPQTGNASSFQFHYGTIKRSELICSRGMNFVISIPLWYD